MRNRGVVMEIGPKKRVIIMTAQGEFVQVPFNKHVQVGQEIRYKPRKEQLTMWQMGMVAALFLLLVGTWPLLTERLITTSIIPAFIITVDINPSIELHVSEDQKVLLAEGLNRDGQEFTRKLALVGLSLREALEKMTGEAKSSGYIRQGQNEVVVTIAAQNDQSAALTEVRDLKNRANGEYAVIEQIIVDAFNQIQFADVRIWEVPRSFQTEAKLAGIPPSRYIAIQIPTPASPIIPQRPETKLTMNDLPEMEDTLNSGIKTPSIHGNTQNTRPALTPSQWTKSNSSGAQRASLYNVNFSVAGIRGDF